MTKKPTITTKNMTIEQAKAAASTIGKCVITSGLALVALSAIGCSELAESPIVDVAYAESSNKAGAVIDLIGRLAGNHNEESLS